MRLLKKVYDPPQNFLNAIIDNNLDDIPSNDQEACSEQNVYIYIYIFHCGDSLM